LKRILNIFKIIMGYCTPITDISANVRIKLIVITMRAIKLKIKYVFPKPYD